MRDRDVIITEVINAAGGRITGKVRLQKILYILDQLGLRSGFSYQYHYYGPFSRDIVNAVEDAKAFGYVNELIECRKSDGAAFSIFVAEPVAERPAALDPRLQGALSSMLPAKATVLELAATVHWLWSAEGRGDWRAEIEVRKGLKCQGGRLERAIELLKEIGLAPPDLRPN